MPVTSKAVPSVYFGFFCLQVSSVSNFLPDKRGSKVVSYLGSLVQSCCEEGGTVQANITGVCEERSQCLSHTGFATTHGVCASSVYTAQAPGCSAGELSKAGPGFCPFPRSKPLRIRFSGTPQRQRLGWACLLVPFPGLSSSGYQVLGERTLPSCVVS